MFRKLASCEVLEIRSTPEKVSGASLSKFASFEDYKTDDDFIYVRVRAISSRVNKNHDGWPSTELQKSYGTFLHKPIFIDHHNSDPTKARGVIVDAAIHVEEDFDKTSSLDPYYSNAPANHLPPTWIELLLEVDAKRYPKLAKAIISGDIDGVSMGCNVEKSVCSHCGNEAFSPEQYCNHITSKGAFFDIKNSDGTKTSKKSYEDCYDIGFFEISFVFDPADETALASEVKTSKREVYSELGLPEIPTPEDPSELGDDYGDVGFERPTEDQRVYQWRLEQLMQAGISEQEAHILAGNNAIDLNQARQMASQGATADQIMRILSKTAGPINKGWNPQQMQQQQMPASVQGAPGGTAPAVGGQPVGQPMPNMQPAQPGMGQGLNAQEMPFQPGLDNGLFENIPPAGPNQQNPWDEMKMGKTAAGETDPGRNPPPQSEMTSAPDKVDTLRQEQVCPICGSDMEDGVCEVCNYEEPPEGFDNPDLQKAKQVDQQMREQDADQAAAGQGDQAPNNLPLQPDAGDQTGAPGSPGQTTSKANAATTVSSEQKISAVPKGTQINTQERPILPVARRVTDKPLNVKTLQDSKTPVQSNTTKDNMTQTTQKIADGATPQGEGVQAEKRVDVEGVGAVTGDPLSGIDHENVETDTGDFTAPHTETWSGDEGDSLGQQDPVTSEVFEGGPESGNAVGVSSPPPHNSSFEVVADGSGDLGGPIGDNMSDGASGVSGTSTWDTSAPGFPDHDPARVDLLSDLKEEVGEGTQTDSSEQFRSLKHTEPVTHEQNGNDLGGPIGTAMASAKAQIFKAFKVAETEIDLGIIENDAKYDRVAELEGTSESILDAQLETLSKVRTAGLRKGAAKTSSVGRLPSLQNRTAAVQIIENSTISDDDFLFA